MKKWRFMMINLRGSHADASLFCKGLHHLTGLIGFQTSKARINYMVSLIVIKQTNKTEKMF